MHIPSSCVALTGRLQQPKTSARSSQLCETEASATAVESIYFPDSEPKLMRPTLTLGLVACSLLTYKTPPLITSTSDSHSLYSAQPHSALSTSHFVSPTLRAMQRPHIPPSSPKPHPSSAPCDRHTPSVRSLVRHVLLTAVLCSTNHPASPCSTAERASASTPTGRLRAPTLPRALERLGGDGGPRRHGWPPGGSRTAET